MTPSTILRALGAVALISLAAPPANAQSTAQAGSRPAPPRAREGRRVGRIPAGTYHLDIQLPERVMGAALTITDSSGTATASLFARGRSGRARD